VDVATFLFVFWQKISLLKVLCWKAHCLDTEYTCLAKVLVSFNEHIAVNVAKLLKCLSKFIFIPFFGTVSA